eukprot:scaffold81114_cov59-Phaeocystis_antarctica.AAC.5
MRLDLARQRFTHLPHVKRHDVLMNSAFLMHSPLAAQPWHAAPASSAQPALARGSAAAAAAGAGGGAGLRRRESSEEEKRRARRAKVVAVIHDGRGEAREAGAPLAHHLRGELPQQARPDLGLPQVHGLLLRQDAGLRAVELRDAPRVPRRPVELRVVDRVHGVGHLLRELEGEAQREAVPHRVAEAAVPLVPHAQQAGVGPCEHESVAQAYGALHTLVRHG